MRVLTVNAGSSSLRLRLLDGEDTIAARDLRVPRASPDTDGAHGAPRAWVDAEGLHEALRAGLGEADAVGHRIVHGGRRFRSAVRIDAGVQAALRELVDLAPLHQPRSLATLDAVTEALPDVPAVACFDTAFHASLPDAAATYALPADWRERWELRRYGFHGLSHAWIARRAPELLERDSSRLAIVSCHLGAGASLCAIGDGRSLDTTMGFTPLEGLAMATRSGSVDPGLLLWLMEHEGLSADALADALEHRSGLLGLAGSADMAEVVRRASGAEDRDAVLALDVYVHRLRAGIAAMAAALGGLDALVFTGGVGERSAAVRELAVAELGFLGLAIDPRRNRAAGADGEVSAQGAAAATLVIAAREDLEIARQVTSVLAHEQ